MRTKILLASLIVGLSGASQAELHDRGGGMIYDDVLDITWLQDANAGAGSAFDDGIDTADGRMRWANAVAWADSLNFGGFNDWRLPSMDVNGDHSPDGGIANGIVDCFFATELECRDNELGYMYYQNLGGTMNDDLRGDQSPFTNIQSFHWSGTEFALDPSQAWAYAFFQGHGGPYRRSGFVFSAWAVRAGDVPPTDADSDGVANAVDNCTLVANPDQRDTNGDGHGNVCDFDYDNNCATNFFDLFPFSEAFGSMASDPNFNEDVDLDGNGVINFLDFGTPPNNFAAFFTNPPGPSATVCGAAP